MVSLSDLLTRPLQALGRALTPPSAGTTADAAPSGRARGVGDELYAGEFYAQQDHVRHALDGGWEPRAPYSDVVREMLGRTGLAYRVLSIRPLDATREGWAERFPSLDPQVAEAATRRLDTQQTELSAQMRFFQALFKRNRDGESIIVMGVDDGGKLSDELNMQSIRTVMWLKVFGRADYVPGPLSPPTSRNFDLPEYYDISDFTRPSLLTLDASPRQGGQVRVHHTRVLRFATVDGSSVLDSVGQALEDYFASSRSARRAASVFSIVVFGIRNWLTKYVADEDAAAKRMSLQHMALRRLGALVRDLDDEEVEWQGQPNSGLADLVDRAAAALCAWAGLPAMLLFGQDPAGFSSGAEVVRHYYDTVRVEQTLSIAPQLRRLLEILMVAEDGPPEIEVPPTDWQLVFRPLRVLTAEERAKVREIVSRTAAYLKDAQVVDRDEARASLPREGDDVPDLRLSATATMNERERLEVGIVQALAQLVTEYYGGMPPPDAMKALVTAAVPELSDVVERLFAERSPGASSMAPAPGAEELGDALGTPTELEVAAEREALAAEPEQWLEADEIRRHFSVSKATLRKHRGAKRGAAVDPGPGRYRWIAPDGRPRYRLSEVRAVLEAEPDDGSAPAPAPTSGDVGAG